MNLPQLQREIHDNAKAHGWWETPRPVPEILCLIHAEVSEALEAYRDGNLLMLNEEMADIVIRTMDAAEAWGVDLLAEILRKHEKNKRRPYRHGGKLA